jgi:ATP-binding cassette subfamily F protein uup
MLLLKCHQAAIRRGPLQSGWPISDLIIFKRKDSGQNMNLLTVENVTKAFTDKVLFDHISFGMNEGDKVGIIGINGTGKSTFLKIAAGLEEADTGSVTKGNKVRVAYLPQNPKFDDEKTILENVTKGRQQIGENWSAEGHAKAMLKKLGIYDLDAMPSKLSGGQRKRAALAETLLEPSDILILDEPTNHLDNEMAEWLEDYLRKYQGAFLMVTHDRYFLDKVSNKIIELDRTKLYSYQTNYSGFLKLKAEREEMELATERKKASLYRQDLEWMMRGARARSTKQKAHIERFEELKNRERPVEQETVTLSSVSSRMGKTTVELEGISKAYGNNRLFEDFTYYFLKNDRVGIVGHNGCGKSTLLKIMQKVLEPDTGSVKIGETIKMGYFSQENESLPEEETVIQYIRDTAEYIETPNGQITAAKMLERFLFSGSMQYAKIGRLSGGEKRRLYLCRVLMEAPNFLILDEPTNDLDIQTLTILEHYLDSFQGIVVTVSHDRYFLDRIVQRIFAFENGTIVQYEGGFTDYRTAFLRKGNADFIQETKKIEETAAQDLKEVKKADKKWNTGRENKVKMTYQEQKDFEVIDEVIEKLEQRLAGIEEEILKNATNAGKLNELTGKKTEIENELEEKTQRWVYLNELAEKIAEQK